MQARPLVLPALVATLALGCSLGSPTESAGGPDAAPIRIKTPSTGDKTGTGTSPGCDGVTGRGECQGEVAVSCDIENDRLDRTDCKALGKRCIVYTSEGAICQAVDNSDRPSCDDGLDIDGYCDGQTARWCDDEGEKAWDCSMQPDKECVENSARGAYCSHVSGGADAGAGGGGSSGNPECAELGNRGECGGEYGQTARYCYDGELIELDCTARADESCQVDTCAEGAFCCSGNLECPDLGYEGECQGDTVRFCTTDGQYGEIDCAAEGKLCGVDCSEDVGADCCEPTCEEVGVVGTCIDDTLVYCSGGEIQKQDCTSEPGFTHCEEAGGCVDDAASCCP